MLCWQTSSATVGVEIIALVVDEDERREILHLNLPHRLHAKLGILNHLDFLDVLLRENRRRPADAAEIKSAMFLARGRDLRPAIALREHDHRTAQRLKRIDVTVHPSRSGRPE